MQTVQPFPSKLIEMGLLAPTWLMLIDLNIDISYHSKWIHKKWLLHLYAYFEWGSFYVQHLQD